MFGAGSVVFFTHLSPFLCFLCIFFKNPHEEKLEDTVPSLSDGETLKATVSLSVLLFLQLFLWYHSCKFLKMSIMIKKYTFAYTMMFFFNNNCCQCWTLMTLHVVTLSTTNPRHFRQPSPHPGEMCREEGNLEGCAAFGNPALSFTSQSTSLSLMWFSSSYHGCTNSIPLVDVLPK